MKSKDLIAMGIIAAAALSFNGMTASANENGSDTSYEAPAPSYSDSNSDGGSGSESGSSNSSSSSGSGMSSSSTGSVSGSSDSDSSDISGSDSTFTSSDSGNSDSAYKHTNSSDADESGSENTSGSNDSADISSDSGQFNESSSTEECDKADSETNASSSNGISDKSESNEGQNSAVESAESDGAITDTAEEKTDSTESETAEEADHTNETGGSADSKEALLPEDSGKTLDSSVDLKQSFALSDILGAELLSAGSEEYLEGAEETTESQEPDTGKTYTAGDYIFAYKEGKWQIFYLENYSEETSTEGGMEITNFQILDDDQQIYQYEVMNDEGSTYTRIVGINENTENVTWFEENDDWFLYKGNLYQGDVKYDSLQLTDHIYAVNYRSDYVSTIIGWTDSDVQWMDSYHTLFMYDSCLYVTDPDYIEAYKLKIEKTSEDNHIIWFTDPLADGLDYYPDRLRMTGWNESDITWINKEAGLFELNSTGEFYLTTEIIDDFASDGFYHLKFGSAYLLKNAELLDGKPIVQFTSEEHDDEGNILTKERIVGWTLENVDYTVSIDGILLIKVGNKWYSNAIDNAFAQADREEVTSENITKDILRLTCWGTTYLTGIPENVEWISLPGKDSGLFEFDGSVYLIGENKSGLAVKTGKVETIDGVIFIDDQYLLNWNGKATVSPDGTFFYNGVWYHSDDNTIAEKITLDNKEESISGEYPEFIIYDTERGQWSIHHDDGTIDYIHDVAIRDGVFEWNGAWYRTEDNIIAKQFIPPSETAETVGDSEYIVYDSEMGWILQYNDSTITPINKYVETIPSSGGALIVRDAFNYDSIIVGCVDSRFLSLCDQLYYGKSGLEAFVYKNDTYFITSTNIAKIADADETDSYFYGLENNIRVKVDKDGGQVIINDQVYRINTEQSTDEYIAYGYYDERMDAFVGDGVEGIVNWSWENVICFTKLSYDPEAYGSFYGTNDGFFYYEYVKKGQYPYVNSLYFKLNDGYWYKYQSSNFNFSDNEKENMEGLPAERLPNGSFDENGVMYDDSNRIIGINHISSGIQWIQNSDFVYYDTLNSGVCRKIPAWFVYNNNYYVTYDGYSAHRISLADSKNGIFKGSIYVDYYGGYIDWLYSDWDNNDAVTWLTRSYDSGHHAVGWFIYDDGYYYTKDGKSAKLYENSIPLDVFIYRYGFEDTRYWRNYLSVNSNYHSSGAVAYAKEHVYDLAGSNNDDCANYVSYCLFAGGLMTTDQWRPESDAWILVAEQVKYLQNYGTLTVVNQSRPDIKIGDPVYYDFDGNGVFDHVAICVSYDKETGKPVVYDHSSSRLIKMFDELEAEVIATIAMPDFDMKDDTSALILSEEILRGASYRSWTPKIYLINWDVSKADYYLFGDRYRQAGSKKGIFTYRGYWWMSEDGQTAINCGPVQSSEDENQIIKSTLLLTITGEQPIYLTDSDNPDITLSVYIDDDLDIKISNVGTKSYYQTVSEGSSKAWQELTDGIHIQKYDSDQINAIFTLNGGTYITFDGLTAYPLSNIEWKAENGLFNRFTMAAKKAGNDSVFISEWDADKADFDTYLKEGGKITFRFVYDSETKEQLRTGYFIYDDNGTEKWFYSADGVTAAFKSNVYIEDKFVLPGEGEMGFRKNSKGEWVYVDSDGNLVKDQFVTQGGRKFYLDSDGLLSTGWIPNGNARYYANEHGIIQTGSQTIGGVRYVFDSSGALVRVEQNNNSGNNSAAIPADKGNADKNKTAVSPIPAAPAGEINITDLILDRTKTSDEPASEQTNYLFPLIFGGSALSLRDVSGTLLDGWIRYSGSWYYYDTGVMQRSWLTFEGKRYYLDPVTGMMQTGWRNIEDNWYYFNDNGTMQTGWAKIEGKWYYFDEDGVMQTGWTEIDEKWYYFDEDGVKQTEWMTLDNKTYYLGTDGARVSGRQTIDGKEYEFDDDGVLTSGEGEE